MVYLKLFEAIKDLKDFTFLDVKPKVDMSDSNIKSNLKHLCSHSLLVKTGFVKIGKREFRVYNVADTEKCKVCGNHTRLFQKITCFDCLIKKFKPLRPLLEVRHG